MIYPSVEKASAALTRAQARQAGHEITVFSNVYQDDSEAWSECTCGWKSKEVRAGAHAYRLGQEHIAEEAQWEVIEEWKVIDKWWTDAPEHREYRELRHRREATVRVMVREDGQPWKEQETNVRAAAG